MKGSENVLAGDESPATEAEDAARSFLARFAQADNPEVFVFVTLIFVMKHKLTNARFVKAGNPDKLILSTYKIQSSTFRQF